MRDAIMLAIMQFLGCNIKYHCMAQPRYESSAHYVPPRRRAVLVFSRCLEVCLADCCILAHISSQFLFQSFGRLPVLSVRVESVRSDAFWLGTVKCSGIRRHETWSQELACTANLRIRHHIVVTRAYSKEFFRVHNFKSSCMM